MKHLQWVVLTFFMTNLIYAGGKITGKITDESTGNGLPAANIMLNAFSAGTTSDRSGNYTLDNIAEGSYELRVSFMGYKPFIKSVEVKGDESVTVDVALVPTSFQTDEIVITATKTERKINEIPNRVQVVTAQTIQNTPVESVDDVLQYTSGLSVSRTAGIWSNKSIVNFRGLSTEQGRTLILYDGSNINKTDGGSVNWNFINPLTIDHIEISKGANSSLYGNNAMGGVINIINKKPSGLFHAVTSTEYGTFNTIGNKFYAASSYMNFYAKFQGQYRKSDGYITDLPADKDSNTIKCNLDEMQVGGTLGYDISRNHSVEFSTLYYDGTRGTGERFLIGTKEGDQITYKNSLHQFRYRGAYNKTSWNAQAFYLKENYVKRDESIKSNALQRYDVDSKRFDKGMGFNATQILTENNKLTGGMDMKWGRVDGADVYKTSADQVINRGKMVFTSGYLQDEWNFMDNRVKVIGGLRYDHAQFSEGEFFLINSTNVTKLLRKFQDTLPNKTWQAISPKISVQYNQGELWRVFALYGRGFRPPVLDDMCRTGSTNKALTLANPALKPETMDNFEMGLDVRPFDKLGISASSFYSVGNDFIYSVSTGLLDTTSTSPVKTRPIMHKDNISKVEFYGAEFDMNMDLHPKFTAFLNYSYIHTEIKDFEIKDPTNTTDLNGKHLTDVSPNQFNMGFTWKYHKYFNLTSVVRYKDKMWLDDINTMKNDYYTTVDLKVWSQINRYLSVAVSCQNLGNERYEDKSTRAPGRLLFAELTVQY